jgi:hypothetical protein
VCTLGTIPQRRVWCAAWSWINPDWDSGVYFHDNPGAPPQGFRLYPTQTVSPAHYLSPSSRDWYARR